MDRGEGSTELETPENGLQPSRQEPESLKERSTSVSSFSTVDDSSLTISGSVAGADSVSDYASIGVDESFRSVGARRRLVRKENEELRRDILTSLKVDIAAGSAKLFVTNRLLKRSIGNTNVSCGFFFAKSSSRSKSDSHT